MKLRFRHKESALGRGFRLQCRDFPSFFSHRPAGRPAPAPKGPHSLAQGVRALGYVPASITTTSKRSHKPLPRIVAPLGGARYFLGARPRARRPCALLLDAFGVLRERHAVANNARLIRTFGRGEPLVFALFPVPVARGSLARAGRGVAKGFAGKQRGASSSAREGCPLLMSESQRMKTGPKRPHRRAGSARTLQSASVPFIRGINPAPVPGAGEPATRVPPQILARLHTQ
jgi:hypothetical protein